MDEKSTTMTSVEFESGVANLHYEILRAIQEFERLYRCEILALGLREDVGADDPQRIHVYYKLGRSLQLRFPPNSVFLAGAAS